MRERKRQFVVFTQARNMQEFAIEKPWSEGRMIFGSSQNKVRIQIGVGLLLSMLLAVGFWLRARHLGDLGLIVDEGIQALAVQGILKHGVPNVDSGLIYTRSIPFLYTQALAAKLFGLNEFSFRLPSALFGVAAILAAYGSYALQLADRPSDCCHHDILGLGNRDVPLWAILYCFPIHVRCFALVFLPRIYGRSVDLQILVCCRRSHHVLFAPARCCARYVFAHPLLSSSYSPQRKLLLGL